MMASIRPILIHFGTIKKYIVYFVMMNWGINRIIVMSTVFVVGATLTAAILVSPVVTPMTASAFALDENMTGAKIIQE